MPKSLIVLLYTIFNFLAYSQTIFDLARQSEVELMKDYLDKNPSEVNILSEQGLSPFLISAYRGNTLIARLLIERGADIKACYEEGSAVYGAIYKNNTEILKLLIENGINLNDTCQFKQFGAPIHFAMSLKRYELLKIILQENINLKLIDQNERSINQLLTIYNDDKLNELFKK